MWMLSSAHILYLRNVKTILSNGYLGSRNDEERSEMRYVMRIAEFSESSNLWTQIALDGNAVKHTSLSIAFTSARLRVGKWVFRCFGSGSLEVHELDYLGVFLVAYGFFFVLFTFFFGIDPHSREKTVLLGCCSERKVFWGETLKKPTVARNVFFLLYLWDTLCGSPSVSSSFGRTGFDVDRNILRWHLDHLEKEGREGLS